MRWNTKRSVTHTTCSLWRRIFSVSLVLQARYISPLTFDLINNSSFSKQPLSSVNTQHLCDSDRQAPGQSSARGERIFVSRQLQRCLWAKLAIAPEPGARRGCQLQRSRGKGHTRQRQSSPAAEAVRVSCICREESSRSRVSFGNSVCAGGSSLGLLDENITQALSQSLY